MTTSRIVLRESSPERGANEACQLVPATPFWTMETGWRAVRERMANPAATP
jgi:hypothetical protein